MKKHSPLPSTPDQSKVYTRVYKNGFCFVFWVEVDPEGKNLLQKEFGDLYHFDGPNNLQSLTNYVKQVGSTEDSLIIAMKRVDKTLSAIRQTYYSVLTFGTEWNYYKLTCKVFLDIESYRNVLLVEKSVSNLKSLGRIKLHIDLLTNELFPEAFSQVLEQPEIFNLDDLSLVYSPSGKTSPSLSAMFHFLNDGDATIIALGVKEDITADNIRKWVRGTIDFNEEEEDEELKEMFSDKVMLGAIYDSAEELAEYILELLTSSENS